MIFIDCHIFCIDFHEKDTSPGLGDRTKESVLLYQCDEKKCKIIHIWGTADTENIASKKTVTEMDIFKSTIWKWVLPILLVHVPSFDHNYTTHFHDYTNIESI